MGALGPRLQRRPHLWLRGGSRLFFVEAGFIPALKELLAQSPRDGSGTQVESSKISVGSSLNPENPELAEGGARSARDGPG